MPSVLFSLYFRETLCLVGNRCCLYRMVAWWGHWRVTDIGWIIWLFLQSTHWEQAPLIIEDTVHLILKRQSKLLKTGRILPYNQQVIICELGCFALWGSYILPLGHMRKAKRFLKLYIHASNEHYGIQEQMNQEIWKFMICDYYASSSLVIWGRPKKCLQPCKHAWNKHPDVWEKIYCVVWDEAYQNKCLRWWKQYETNFKPSWIL